MRDIFNNRKSISYNNLEWLCIKVPFILFFLLLSSRILLGYSKITFPVALCTFGCCDWILIYPIKIFVLIILMLFSVTYIFEYKMNATLGFLSIISVIVFSLEESNGIMNRASLISMVFIAQWIAYLLYHKQSNKLIANRIQFSIQLVVATYMLSAISKLVTSGINWVSDSQYAVLQIQKSIYYNFYDSTNLNFILDGNQFVQYIDQHGTFFRFLFLSALIIEFTVFIALFNKKTRILYGLLLLSMHIGIFVVMDIIIPHVFIPMILLFLNPIYFLVSFLKWSFNQLKR